MSARFAQWRMHIWVERVLARERMLPPLWYWRTAWHWLRDEWATEIYLRGMVLLWVVAVLALAFR